MDPSRGGVGQLIDPIVSKDDDYNNYENILTEDFMYPAWDITNKKPLFFSSSVIKKETTDP